MFYQGGVKRFIILAVFVCAVCFASQSNFNFILLDSPSKGIIQPVKYVDANEFWVSEINGKLFYYNNGNWFDLGVPKFDDIQSITYSISDSSYIALLVTDAFITKVYKRTEREWVEQSYQAKVPVRNVFPKQNGDHFAYGDWGTVFIMKKDTIIDKESPIDSHILSHCILPNGTIILGTESSGIYSFDGKEFKKFDFAEKDHNGIIAITYDEKNNTFNGLARNGQLFSWDNKTLINSKNNKNTPSLIRADFITHNEVYAIDRNRALQYYDSSNWRIIATELNETPAGVLAHDNRNFIVTSDKGTVLLPSYEEKLYFIDRGGAKYISGTAFEKSIGGAIIDINNDNALDIFVMNGGNKDQLSRLYLNKEGSYHDVSYSFDLPSFGLQDLFSFVDINDDNYLDLVKVYYSDDRYYIDLYLQKGNQFILKAKHAIDDENLSKPTFIAPFNIENDEDADLLLGFYYSSGNTQGRIKTLKNSFYGNLIDFRNEEFDKVKGWYQSVIYADFNMDNKGDLYFLSKWRDNHFLLKNENTYIYMDATHDSHKENTYGGLAIDIDNDGDLDLCEIHEGNHLGIYRNNGSGEFSDITTTAFPSFETSHFSLINSGDFNLDGFIDLIGSYPGRDNDKLSILLNQDGAFFKEVQKGIGLGDVHVNSLVVSDLDNDGDLDIYGFRNGINSAWFNTLNTKNYLKVQPIGVKGPISAFGTKVWVYKNGRLNDFNSLIGFRQVGSDNYNSYQINSNVLHFGLPDSGFFDIKILFPSGVEHNFESISNDTLLIVRELEGFERVINQFPSTVYHFVSNITVILYLLLIVAGTLIAFFTIWTGINTYHWNTSITIQASLGLTTIFWLLIFLTINLHVLLKFGLPIFGIGSASMLLIAYSRQLKKNRELSGNREDALKALVKYLEIFSHGGWVLANLNSIQLLSENGLTKEELSGDFKKLFIERAGTFENLVVKEIDALCKMFFRARLMPQSINDLNENSERLLTGISNVIKSEFDKKAIKDNHGIILNSVIFIRNMVSDLKSEVLSHFSCDVNQTVTDVISSLRDTLKKAGVECSLKTEPERKAIGLIPQSDLAFIIDNLVQNSIKATKDIKFPRVLVSVFHKDPSIIIVVKDNGLGIPGDKLKDIFNEGYSTFNSSGIGLSSTKQMLKTFNGKIRVNSNPVNRGTTFTIELKEGVIKK